MDVTPRSEEEARRASSRELIKPGWHGAMIVEATEKQSRRGNPMLELLHLVPLPDGSDRELRSYLTDTNLGAELLRSAVVAVDALEAYQNGSIGGQDFAGRSVQILVGIEKRGRGLPDVNYIQSYRALPAEVVNLRAVE